MIQRTFLTLVLVSLVSGAAATAAAPSRAQTTSVSLSPARFEVDAKPGESGETTIEVTNEGEETFSVKGTVEPYPESPEETSAVDWLKLDPASFDVNPGETQTVTIQVAVPESATSGGRYARVAFQAGTPNTEEVETGVFVTPRVAASVALIVDGDQPLSRVASIAQFAPVMEFDGRVGFRAEIQSEGNVHLDPTGIVELSSPAGESLADAELPSIGRILPGTNGTLSTIASLPLTPGDSYVASLELEGEMDEPLTAEVEFTNDLAIEVGELSICENLDRGPTVGLQVVNSGDVGVAPQLDLSVTTAAGAVSSATSPPGSLLVWPESTEEIGGDLADRLPTGDYTLRASLQAGPGDPIVAELPFSIGGLGENAAPICEGSGL